ncbi:MAG TPA: Gfo/Idh/MocA family oxidoreductase, partial [Propionibacteriaceae bacterium]|nr:Gfo/Idh/MocA family oxidoreductase [Propionibacteriaceae bacterium]
MTTYPIPSALTPLPADRPVRVGVLATGHIARKVTRDMQLVPDDVRVTAVGSRTQAAADAFADELSIPHAFGSYEELAASGEVDVVYVTTPHNYHAEAARLCMDAGLGVLVEKPLTPTAADTHELVQYASDKGVFLMEAVWTRCNPLIRRAVELVREGALGDVRWIQAAFGFRFHGDSGNRLVNPDLAG